METLLTHASSLDLFRRAHANHPMLPVLSFANVDTVTGVDATARVGRRPAPARRRPHTRLRMGLYATERYRYHHTTSSA